MKFINWIDAQGGPTPLAAKLGIDSMTVRHWILGNATPKALVMQRLVKMGKGAFGYDDIINVTSKKIRGKK